MDQEMDKELAVPISGYTIVASGKIPVCRSSGCELMQTSVCLTLAWDQGGKWGGNSS